MKYDSYMDLVSDYFFTNNVKYSKSDIKTVHLAIDVITTHGVGGKFVEGLIRHRFRMKDTNNIHGWDGFKGSRPVEIKTETINYTKALSCEGSFGDHRRSTIRKKDLFLQEKPFLYSVGVDNICGKCIYVMETDISKLNKNCLLFERLDARAPRISLAHWVHQRAHKIVYKNEELIESRKDNISNLLLTELRM